MGERTVLLENVTCPVFNIYANNDHLVPPSASIPLGAHVGSKVYEAGQTAGQYVGTTVQEQPLLSLIGIAAIGYLVGYLVHSPSRPLAPEPRYRRVIRRWS